MPVNGINFPDERKQQLAPSLVNFHGVDMKLLYRMSILTGLFPVLAGILLFIVWAFTRATWIESSSAFFLYSGFFLILFGFVVLLIYNFRARQYSNRIYRKSSLFPLIILLMNFPLNAILYNSALYIKSTSIIVIENNSDFVVKKMYLTNGDKDYFIEPVEPHEKRVKALIFEQSGVVRYSFEIDNREVQGTMFHDLEIGTGGKSSMKISRIGNVIVSENI